jgi:hypothetical protein
LQNFGALMVNLGLMSSSSAAFAKSCVAAAATEKQVHDFLYLRGKFDVGVCSSAAARFAELTPHFFYAKCVETDRVLFSEISAHFPDAELDALRSTVSEFNALRPKTAQDINRRLALGAHIRLLMELYASHVQRARNEHRKMSGSMPSAVCRAVRARARGEEVEDVTALAKHFQVSSKKALATLDAHIAEARQTLWVEDILSDIM